MRVLTGGLVVVVDALHEARDAVVVVLAVEAAALLHAARACAVHAQLAVWQHTTHSHLLTDAYILI